MSEEKCCNCKYFQQHYGLGHEQLFRLMCGHCTRKRGKGRRPCDKACPQFVAGERAEEGFVKQYYLTKALLHHVLSLPLLPEIREAPEE